MDLIIQYRNERKQEGATKAELSLYDGQIRAFDSSSPSKSALLPELLIYRRQLKEEGVSSESIALVDKMIYSTVGNTVARIVDIKIRQIKGAEFAVSVDLNNETVENLLKKVANTLGKPSSLVRLIYKGRHLEYDESRLLCELGIGIEDSVGLCFRMGCDGRGCCDSSYNMLCDALLRKSDDLFKGRTEEEIKKLLGIYSKIVNTELSIEFEAKRRVSTEPPPYHKNIVIEPVNKFVSKEPVLPPSPDPETDEENLYG